MKTPMEYLKNFYSFINEIIYNQYDIELRFISNSIKKNKNITINYEFEIEDVTYEWISIFYIDIDSYEFIFTVKGLSVDTITNNNHIFKILGGFKSIFDQSFLKAKELYARTKVEFISFKPIKKDKEKNTIAKDTKRGKIYIDAISQQFNVEKISSDYSTVTLQLNKIIK